MLKQLLQITRQLLGLAQDTQANKADIKVLQCQMETLSATVRELTFEIRGVREHDAHEREKLALSLENALLRFERQLLIEQNSRAELPEAIESQDPS